MDDSYFTHALPTMPTMSITHAYYGLEFLEMQVSMLDLPNMHSRNEIEVENKVYEGSHGPARHC